MEADQSQVKHFYDDAYVFITGGTGFLGKLLIEKLLRYTLVTKVFILVRCKKGKNESDRCSEIFEQKIFDFLKDEKPDFLKRVELIPGDCALPDLGISALNWERLKANVNVVFHCAATVRFDQKIKAAGYINVRATMDIIRHAKEMQKLKAFIHVSTAFANCPRKEIDEVFYEPAISPKSLFGLLDNLTDEELDAYTPSLIGKWPNTYVFTKSISEYVVRTEAVGLPVALLRPSIVISTYHEPFAGWIDNFYGALGCIYGVGMGILRVIRCHPKNFADVVPADYVINMMLTSAWKVSKKYAGENHGIDVYNYVSTPEAPINWGNFLKISLKRGLKAPFMAMIWTPMLVMTTQPWVYQINYIFLHWAPAYIMDFVCLCIGKKARLVDGYKKLDKFTDVIEYFTTREWNFLNNNTQELWRCLNEEDRKIFPFCMGNVNWDEYFRTCTLGTRVYLAKDPIETIPAARRKLFILNCLHYTLISVIVGCLLWFLYKCFV